MSLLSLQSATIAFGGPPVLDRADFGIERGERVCLLGRNGAGKSTIMKLLDRTMLPDSGEVIRGQKVIVPADAKAVKVTPELLEGWVVDGWVDLRLANCERWVDRFRRIQAEIDAMPAADTSSRFLRNRRFWHEERPIQPGKVVGWILGTQEAGARIKR